MKSLQRALFIMVCVGFLPGLVLAEFRPWIDQKGNSIEAEYVRITGETLVLRKRGGGELKVPLQSLSDEDRQFAMLQNPPKIEIKVEDDVDSDTVGYTRGLGGGSKVSVASVIAEVKLKKKNIEPYEAELTLDIILIGKTGSLDRYTVIERSSSQFSFTEENKGLHLAACGPVDIRNISGNANAGVEYEGFLVLISDSQEAVIAAKGSRIEFEKHREALLEAERGATFDKDFNKIESTRTSGDPRRGSNRSSE